MAADSFPAFGTDFAPLPGPSRQAFPPPLESPALTALPKGRVGSLKSHQEGPISKPPTLTWGKLTDSAVLTGEGTPRKLGCKDGKLRSLE